jgi:outer membrane immunogenic protein
VDDANNDRGFASVGGELSSVATVRGRLGLAFDNVMVYGTGGAAFAGIKSSLGLTCLTDGCGGSTNPLAASVSSSTNKTGWVAGAGVEWMVANNWILRAEYQHIDLGSVSAAPLSPGCDGCSLSASQNLRLDIGRVGFSYKFGG